MSNEKLEPMQPAAVPDEKAGFVLAPKCGDGETLHVLLDVADPRQAGSLRAQARRCRSLAQTMTDQQAVDALLAMASEYDAKAQSLRTE